MDKCTVGGRFWVLGDISIWFDRARKLFCRFADLWVVGDKDEDIVVKFDIAVSLVDATMVGDARGGKARARQRQSGGSRAVRQAADFEAL